METKKTIAIINDPQVTLGSIQPNDIDQIFAWEIDWKSLSPKDNYIILGGHMGAYDTEVFPYLTSEKKWLRKVIPLGTKILGICLGAQLIADAMGGKAYLSDEIEFGFKKLEFHNNYDFLSKFENLSVFVWHRDTFTLPPDAELIATSEFPQIFKLFNTFALQFHPEITKELFDIWYNNDISKKELSKFNISQVRTHLANSEELIANGMNKLYEDWKNLKL